MPTLCVNKPNTRVSLTSERLEITGPDADGNQTILRTVPIRDVERVLLTESVQLTSRALVALLRRDIPVTLYGWNGQYLGGFQPPGKPHGLARLTQYRRVGTPAFALQIAGRIITAKLYNQRRSLQRLTKNRRRQTAEKDGTPTATAQTLETGQKTVDQLHKHIAGLKRATTIDTLRGIEGITTAAYFSGWAGFLPAAFPFERRSRRPPLNPVNACISFGATLLYNESVSTIHAHGLDPALGLLHTTQNSRWSLALDLIEPFRPVLIEALALDLFSHSMLAATHFEERDGGTYLNEQGRRIFIHQYETRMERQFMSESVGHRTTLRRQLENQAILLKAALDQPEKFEPFLMN